MAERYTNAVSGFFAAAGYPLTDFSNDQVFVRLCGPGAHAAESEHGEREQSQTG